MDQDQITDQELDRWANNGSLGERKSAPFLRPLTPEQRRTAVREANVRMHMSPGWNFSGAVSQAAKDVTDGQTPCLDRAAAEREREQKLRGR